MKVKKRVGRPAGATGPYNGKSYTKGITVTIPTELIASIDELANKENVSRSAMFVKALKLFVDQKNPPAQEVIS